MLEDVRSDLVQTMENAGRNLADLAQRLFAASSATVLAGAGGNGGGGLIGAGAPDGLPGKPPGPRRERRMGQTQLDIYGELLAAAHLLADRIGGFDEVAAAFPCDLADAAAQRWEEPDHGIWEVRGGPRQFLYSKLMC